MSNYKGNPITPKIAGDFALYAMASSNCYHNDDRETFRIDALDWIVIKSKTHSNGLSYDILEKKGSNKTIFAFRGTDSKLDYLTANFTFLPLSPFNQYKKANKIFKKYYETNQEKEIIVCGHSLGGGLALSISVRHGVPAITFDSSPRIFDGLGNHHKEALRVLIYEDGEILNTVRKLHTKYKEAVREENVFKCSFDFKGSQHRGDKLARALLELGETSNPELTKVLSCK